MKFCPECTTELEDDGEGGVYCPEPTCGEFMIDPHVDYGEDSSMNSDELDSFFTEDEDETDA